MTSKGKTWKLSEESKERHRVASLGHICSEETKRKISEFRKGKTYEEIMGIEKAKEIKERLSKIKTGKTVLQRGHKSDCPCGACRMKRGEGKGKNNPFYGKKHTPETIAKIKKSIKNTMTTDEYHNKRSEIAKNLWKDPERREKWCKTIKELTNKEEYKQKMAEKIREVWKRPEYRENQLKIRRSEEFLSNWHKKRGFKPNLLEKKVISILGKSDLPLIYVGNGIQWIGGKCPDFVDETNTKILEIFGDYWHENDNPQDYINHYSKYGYDTLVLWEHEIYESSDEKIIERIGELYCDTR